MSDDRGYYTAHDIEEILSVKKSKAYEILKMFETRGQLFRSGGTIRVRKSFFNEWLRERETPLKRKDRNSWIYVA